MRDSILSLTIAIATICLMATTANVQSADWPQFQGPERNGISSETGLARSWPADGPKQLWTRSVGKGYGMGAIRDGEVYLLDRDYDAPKEERKDSLLCLDLATGKELWRFEYAAPGSLSHDGTRAVPTVEEKYVYIVSMYGHVNCVDRKTHKAVWSKNVFDLFDGKRPNWGLVQSPVIYKNLLILAPQCDNAGVAALNKNSGAVVWQSPALGGKSSYATPALMTIDGVDQFVMVSGGSAAKGNRAAVAGKAVGVSAADGSILWEYGGWLCSIPIPHPQPLPDGKVYITGGYGAGSAMIQVARKGGKFVAKELFKNPDWLGQIHQPILYKGYLYCDGNGKTAKKEGLVCMALDGEFQWKTSESKSPPKYDRGGLLIADDLIYVVDAAGFVRLVEASPKAYKELACVQLLGGKEIWAPLALSDGKLLIRDQEKMICLDVRNP